MTAHCIRACKSDSNLAWRGFWSPHPGGQQPRQMMTPRPRRGSRTPSPPGETSRSSRTSAGEGLMHEPAVFPSFLSFTSSDCIRILLLYPYQFRNTLEYIWYRKLHSSSIHESQCPCCCRLLVFFNHVQRCVAQTVRTNPHVRP